MSKRKSDDARLWCGGQKDRYLSHQHVSKGAFCSKCFNKSPHNPWCELGIDRYREMYGERSVQLRKS